MRETKLIRDERRARRWLVRSRITAPMSYEAWDLLVRRLCVRAQIGAIVTPLFFFLSFVLMGPVNTLGQTNQARRYRDFGIRFFVLIFIDTLVALAASELTTRAERRIGRGLAHRVSRTEAVTLRVILGPVRSAYLAVTVALETAIAIAVPFAHAGWVGWAYPPAFAVLVAIVVVVVIRARDRLTVAVDPISLAIDERLRAGEVFCPIVALSTLSLAFVVAISSGSALWLFLFWLGSCVVIGTLLIWAQKRPPWWRHEKTSVPPTPVPDAVSR